jgi:TolB-like protein/DNA-binding winged helix-turn-helix (wHTH) protein/Tfp pilus assembly protein PilF
MSGDQAVGGIRFEDVEIDLDGHRLRVQGAEVPLEPKAFAVLALLVRHSGHVLTRDRILDAVWGHAHVTPSVLHRIVTLLRQALGESAGAHRYLHTVHGIGYRFDLPASFTTSPAETTAILSTQESGSATANSAPVSGIMLAPADPVLATGQSSGATRWLRTAGLAVPLLALFVFASWLLWLRMSSHDAAPPATTGAPTLSPKVNPSVAVLPLANASGDQGQQFFSDGLSDNLIDALAKIDGVKVIGRMSSFRFRDNNDDIKSIGAKLGVAYLVSGNVQHVDETVRVGVELSSTKDGHTIWAEHFDRPYKDLFALQDEITQAVAGALQAKLLAPDETTKQGDRPPSGNMEAYSAYLQGLQSSYEQNFPEAAEHFARAVQLDPDYALAWALMSGSLGTVATFQGEPPAVAHEQMHKAQLAVDKALQLAPGLGQAHAVRAHLAFYNFDYRSALAECRRAAQLAPDDGTVLFGCGYTLTGIGKLREAMRLREHLLVIEPLYDVNASAYASLLTATGRLDEATNYFRIAQGLSPPTSPPPLASMYAAIVRGDVKAAQDVARAQPSPWRERLLAVATQISPDHAAADAALAKLIASKATSSGRLQRPYLIAQAYALRGDLDKTMEWLERTPAGDILFMLSDPIILRLRDDPRFIAFCKKAGLPPPSESEALSIDQIRALQGDAHAPG